MKKFLKTLVVGICLFTLLCCALPAAFAAGNTSGSKKEENVYALVWMPKAASALLW